MGYNFSKRLSSLKEQAERDDLGRWGFYGAFAICVFSIALLTFILPKHTDPSNTSWQKSTAIEFERRLQWLQDSPFVLTPGASSIYLGVAQTLDSIFTTKMTQKEEEESSIFNFSYFSVTFGRIVVSCLLRFWLIIIAFIPLWSIFGLLGYYAFRNKFYQLNKTDSLLGVCDRGNGPFYSGIYGPLRPNNSFGATDYACPGLACPAMENLNTALSCELATILKDHGALNKTNTDLVRIILKHGDFPSLLADETAWEEQEIGLKGEIHEEKKSENGFLSNSTGQVKESALIGLSAILEAKRKITIYVDSLEKKGIKSEALDKNYAGHLNNLAKLTASCSPLSKLLIFSLTPTRLWAFGKTPVEMVATAYLSTEAGKCLVYKRSKENFIKISNFPHLQARATLHSVASYTIEYNGDQRLTMRQAIISSRRHGDFGRAFLPIKMPLESKAIRDLLEILYADPDKRVDSANLVELDANIDEIGFNWKTNFANSTRAYFQYAGTEGFDNSRGLPFKSVVLMPVQKVIQLAIEGIHPKRLERVSELLKLTRKSQTKISFSARLPGFKRQALEADDTADESGIIFEKLFTKEVSVPLTDQWKIVRRMLTKFNWMSTRVGDDSIPIAGVVQGTISKPTEFERHNVQDIRGLVPLRHRRFVELFGKQWEANYYGDAPAPELITVFAEFGDEKQPPEDKHKSMAAI